MREEGNTGATAFDQLKGIKNTGDHISRNDDLFFFIILSGFGVYKPDS